MGQKAIQFKGAGLVVNKLIGSGVAPTAVAGTGAGTSPTVTVVGTNVAGTITILTGAAPAGTNATIATLTFAAPYDAIPYVGLSPANANAAALSGATACFSDATSTTASAFVLKAGATALAAATTYVFTYDITG